ncbi:DUF7674 family protein [Alteripontixanthobacter maritimus]|nr:hypothetical protein [Alteripontixanthobacter maritimus]
MFPPLLEADPTFLPKWREFLTEWSDESDDLPLYLALDELAHHLVETQQAGSISNLPKVFDVVERWHVEGDAYVSEAATIGLLESIQNILISKKASKGKAGLDFTPYFGLETRRWWDKLYRFWDGDTSALKLDR